MFRPLIGFFAAFALTGCATAGNQLPSLSLDAKPDIVDTAVAAGSFNTLAAALQAADLVDTLKGPGPFTVFAPTDDAFAALPEGTVENLLKPENKQQLVDILTYHVVPGAIRAEDLAGKTANVATVQGALVAVDGTSGVRVNSSTVTAADVIASNGVIHVIDKVLLPTDAPQEAAAAAPAVVPASLPSGGPDLVETAVSAGSFNTLVAAVQAAGLVDTLKGDGPFTVFAPTDEAFAKLPAGTVESLLLPENKAQLTEILTYHVVPGAVTAGQLAGKRLAPDTVQGRPLAINATSNAVMVNDAHVVSADVLASNGVIHVVDRVILPR